MCVCWATCVSVSLRRCVSVYRCLCLSASLCFSRCAPVSPRAPLVHNYVPALECWPGPENKKDTIFKNATSVVLPLLFSAARARRLWPDVLSQPGCAKAMWICCAHGGSLARHLASHPMPEHENFSFSVWHCKLVLPDFRCLQSPGARIAVRCLTCAPRNSINPAWRALGQGKPRKQNTHHTRNWHALMLGRFEVEADLLPAARAASCIENSVRQKTLNKCQAIASTQCAMSPA